VTIPRREEITMPVLPEGIDRGTLVVVRSKPAEGASAEDLPEFVVGAGYVRAFPDEVDFVRLDGETEEQAKAREDAEADAAPAQAPAKTSPPEGQRRTAADAFN
jgi:hypothetical protein